MWRLDLWEIGKHAALCSNTLIESRSQPSRGTKENEETAACAFNFKVVNRNIRARLQGIQGQGQRGVLFPGDLHYKTGQPVMDVLRYKHPVMRTPDLLDSKCSSFEYYTEDPDVIPLDISKENVMWVAGKLLGVAGPSGAYAMAF